jgi:chemotaxis protein MotB
MTDPGEGPSRDPNEEDIEEARRAQEEARFDKAAEEELVQLINGIPELSELFDSLLIDNTPEGLRIQIIDQDGLPLFPSGSAAMYG